MSPTTTHLAFLAIANTPAYLLVGRLFFDDWADFLGCVRFLLTPDIVSMFRGEWHDDQWSTLRLLVFVALCAAIVYGEYHLLFAQGDQARAALAQPAARH